ncbi:MAG: hypothetical protein SGI92_31340, partial [Bryobacteraceae bacterium]|nr:hypothetical protein [Bryobacteraceae bacterium]
MQTHRYSSLGLLLLASTLASAAPTYTVRTVGPMGYESGLLSLASNGYSAGVAFDVLNDNYGWINRNGTAEILTDTAAVTLINAAGQAAGQMANGEGFFYSGIGTDVIPVGDFFPQFLSVTGVVGGFTSTGSALYKGGALIDLGFHAQIYGMNSAGDVVGVYEDPDGYYHAFSYIGSTWTDLHSAVGGTIDSEAAAINDSGLITGSTYDFCTCTEAAGFTYMANGIPT